MKHQYLKFEILVLKIKAIIFVFLSLQFFSQSVYARNGAKIDSVATTAKNSIEGEPQHGHSILNPFISTSSFIVNDKKTVRELFEKIEDDGKKLQSITPGSLHVLPIAVSISRGGNVMMAINKAIFYPTHIELEVYVRAYIGEAELYFGNQKIRYVPNMGFAGKADLALLGSHVIENDFYKLELSDQANQTSMKIDCGVIEGIALKGIFALKEDKFDRLNDEGFPILGPVSAEVDLLAKNLDDISLEIKDLPAFSIKSKSNIAGFKILNGILDLNKSTSITSEIQNAFNDLASLMGNSKTKTPIWTGLRANSVKVFLPEIFNSYQNGILTRASHEGKDLIITDNGLTVDLSNKNELNINNWSGFAMHSDSIGFEIQRSKLIKFKIDGQLGLPVSVSKGGQLNASNLKKDEFVTFKGTLDTKSEKYAFSITKIDTINFLGGLSKVREGSTINIGLRNIGNGRNIANINISLSGSWSFEINPVSAGGKNLGEFETKIQYEQFNLSFDLTGNRLTPVVNCYRMMAKSPGKIPVLKVGLVVEKLSSIYDNSKEQLNIVFQSTTNLIPFYNANEKGGKSASSQPKLSFKVTLKYDFEDPLGSSPSFNFSNLEYSPFTIKNGDLGELMLSGRVDLDLNGDPIYGNHFKGNIKVKSKSPMLLPITIEVNLIVGYKDFFFMYLDGMYSGPGVPLGPMPLDFTGLGLGFYVNMSKDASPMSDFETQKGAKNFSLNDTKYIPKEESGGFLIAMYVGLRGSSDKLNGSFGIDLEFSGKSDFGITNVGMFGTLNCSSSKIPSDPKPGIIAALKKRALKNSKKLRYLKGKYDAASNSIEKTKTAAGEFASIVKDRVTGKNEEDDEEDEEPPTREELENATASFTVSGNFDLQKFVIDAQLKAYVKITNTLIDTPILVGGLNEETGLAGVATMHVGSDYWNVWIGTPNSQFKFKYSLTDDFKLDLDVFFGFGTKPLESKTIAWNPTIQTAIKFVKDNGSKIDMNYPDAVLGNQLKVFFGAQLQVVKKDSEKKNTTSPIGVITDFSIGLGLAGLITTTNCPAPNTPMLNLKVAVACNGKVAIFANVFGEYLEFTLIKGGAGLLANAEIGGKTFLQGSGFINFSVLGGMLEGEAAFDFEKGEKCTKMTYDLSSGDLNLVKSTNPSEGGTIDRDWPIFINTQHVPLREKSDVILNVNGKPKTFRNVFLCWNWNPPTNSPLHHEDTKWEIKFTPKSNSTHIGTVENFFKDVKVYGNLHKANTTVSLTINLIITDGKKISNGSGGKVYKQLGDFEQTFRLNFKTNGKYKFTKI